jgi:hypothetical protein
MKQLKRPSSSGGIRKTTAYEIINQSTRNKRSNSLNSSKKINYLGNIVSDSDIENDDEEDDDDDDDDYLDNEVFNNLGNVDVHSVDYQSVVSENFKNIKKQQINKWGTIAPPLPLMTFSVGNNLTPISITGKKLPNIYFEYDNYGNFEKDKLLNPIYTQKIIKWFTARENKERLIEIRELKNIGKLKYLSRFFLFLIYLF